MWMRIHGKWHQAANGRVSARVTSKSKSKQNKNNNNLVRSTNTRSHRTDRMECVEASEPVEKSTGKGICYVLSMLRVVFVCRPNFREVCLCAQPLSRLRPCRSRRWWWWWHSHTLCSMRCFVCACVCIGCAQIVAHWNVYNMNSQSTFESSAQYQHKHPMWATYARLPSIHNTNEVLHENLHENQREKHEARALSTRNYLCRSILQCFHCFCGRRWFHLREFRNLAQNYVHFCHETVRCLLQCQWKALIKFGSK